VGATAGVLTALTFLGCMSISIGKFGSTCTVDGLVEHGGETEVQAGAEQDVYYPIPYATIPNLKLTGTHSSAFVLVEQREDHFRVKNTSSCCQEVGWKSRGLRASPCAPAPAATPAPPLVPAPAPAAEPPSPAVSPSR
jgi:hypothetical protein